VGGRLAHATRIEGTNDGPDDQLGWHVDGASSNAIRRQTAQFVSILTWGELEKGVRKLGKSRRRIELERRISALRTSVRNRTLLCQHTAMERRMLLLSLLAVPALAAACNRSSSSELKSLTVDEVQARIAAHDGKTFVYDNNPKERYDEGHLPGARWVSSKDVTAAVLPPDKSATLIFYCASEW
jgi:hypothetical protein